MLVDQSCIVCNQKVAKPDIHFVDEDTFAFLSKPPYAIASGAYCYPCFQEKVAPELDAYEDKMEKARNVNVFYASQSKESRFVRRTEKPIKVENCQDRDECVLRLAFRAIELGMNMLVDVDLKSEKVITAGYQTSLWQGRAIPALVDEAKLKRRSSESK